MKRYLFLFFTFVILHSMFLVHYSSVSASVPRLMTYQGKLTDSLGVGINDTIQITFGLYRTAALGETLWTETHDSVVVTKGLFSVILGSINPLDMPFDSSYFLRIVVDGDPLIPRVRQTASPYAFRAIYADTIDLSNYALWEMGDVTYIGLSPGDVLKWNGSLWVPAVDAGAGGADGDWEVDGANMYSVPVGNVGIGEETPTAKLHINAIDKIGVKIGDSDSIGLHIDDAALHGIYVDSAGYAGIYVNKADNFAGYFNGNGFFRGYVIAGTLVVNRYLDLSYQPIIRSGDGSIDITEDADGSYNITTPNGLGGSGTDNYLARWDGSNSLEASQINESDVGNVGIGTVALLPRLSVYGGTNNGISIRNSANDAMEIFNIVDDGICIYDVGGVGIQIDSTGSSGIIIDDASEYGLRINNSGWAGIRVDSAATQGLYVNHPGGTGIYVYNPEEYGIRVNRSAWTGVRIDSSGSHGLAISNATNDGVWVSNSGGWAGNFMGDVNITQQLFVGNVPTDTDPDFLLTVIGGQIMKVDATAYEGSGLDADWGINGDNLYLNQPGNVGLGIVTPLAKLHINAAESTAILVQTPGKYGMRIMDANRDGIFIDSTFWDGISIINTGSNGISIDDAGDYGLSMTDSRLDGIYIGRGERDGIWVNGVADRGINISGPGEIGVRVYNAGSHGVHIDSVAGATDAGLYISRIGNDGISIDGVGDDGIYIENAGDNAINIYTPGNNGINIGNAPTKSMYIFNAGIDGIELTGAPRTGRGIYIHDHSGIGDPDTGIVIDDVGDIGIGIRAPASKGIAIYDPGEDGFYVNSPARYGVLVNAPTSHGICVSHGNYPDGAYGIYATSVHIGDTVGYFDGDVFIDNSLYCEGDIKIENAGPTLIMDGGGSPSSFIFKYNDDNTWRMMYSPAFTRLSFERWTGSDWATELSLNDENGYVGIGTSVPNEDLDVWGQLKVKSNLDIADSISSGILQVTNSSATMGIVFDADEIQSIGTDLGINDIIHVTTTGRVGIGEPAPAVTLEVEGEGRFRSDADASATLGSGVLQILNALGTSGLHLDNNEVQTLGIDLYLNQSNLSNTHINTFAHFDTMGKVGIGTSAPAGKLHIQSTGSDEPFIVEEDGEYVFGVMGSGRVVVGALVSGATFQVNGTSSEDPVRVRVDGDIKFKIESGGATQVEVLKISGGADLSEQFELIEEPEPGTVVCIDDLNPGKLVVSNNAYDRRVAGIVSGAGGVNPGMLMSHEGTVADGEYPVALTGRVYCKADASNGPIKPGDLLTTSNVPGYAMKVVDHDRAQGAILGKAMSPLEDGQGLVLVLVTLQ